MTLEHVYMLLGLSLLIAAIVVNRLGQRLLDEAKRYADLWESRMNEAHAAEERCTLLLDNARRLRDASRGKAS